MIKVRKLAESDLEFAKSLTDAEEWGNSAEDWNRLEEGKTYKIKGYGFRMGFLDMYPTISSII